MHKAGSSIADKNILDFCTTKGYEIDRISRQVPVSPLPEGDVYIGYQQNIKAEGVYYGMARGHRVGKINIIPSLKIIV